MTPQRDRDIVEPWIASNFVVKARTKGCFHGRSVLRLLILLLAKLRHSGSINLNVHGPKTSCETNESTQCRHQAMADRFVTVLDDAIKRFGATLHTNTSQRTYSRPNTDANSCCNRWQSHQFHERRVLDEQAFFHNQIYDGSNSRRNVDSNTNYDWLLFVHIYARKISDEIKLEGPYILSCSWASFLIVTFFETKTMFRVGLRMNG